MQKITVESARQALKDAIALKGEDYVYTKDKTQNSDHCVYFIDGKPSCLVGHVFAAHGIDPDDVTEDKIVTAETHRTFFHDHSVAWALDAAQSAQDVGASWGDAVERFEEYFTRTAGFRGTDE